MDFKKIILILIILGIAISAIYFFIEPNYNSNDVFYDMGTSANKSTDWICSNMSLVQITPNGTVINNTSPERIAYMAHSTNYWAKNPLCIEFNVVDVSGNSTIHIFDGKHNFHGKLDNAKGSHVKIIINDTLTWWIGNEEQTPFNYTMEDSYIRFHIPPESSITYNDFKIYPI